MSSRIDNFIIREADGVRTANSLVIGRGIPLSTTAGGLPELASLLAGETQLMPSGGDDTQAIRDALTRFGAVRLGPGDFNVSAQIEVGTGQSVAGRGPERTRILAGSAPAPLPAVFRLTGSGPTIEGMSVAGVLAESAKDVRIHHLRVAGTQVGVRLDNVVHGEVSRILAEDVGTGVSATGGEQLVVSGLKVEGGSQGLVLSSILGAQCTGLRFRVDLTAVTASGSALAFSSVIIEEGMNGMRITGSQSVSVSGLHVLNTQNPAVEVTGSSAVALTGCSVRNSEKTSLLIGSSTAVTVDGFLFDMDIIPGPPVHPFVVVGSGSTQVRITGCHRIPPRNLIFPPYEVDVSGAGGRVVFIQHNFDPARINSGGNFAQL